MSLCTSHLGVLMRSGHYSRHGPVNSKDGAGKYFYGIPTRLDPIVAFPTLKSDNKYQNPHLLHRSWQRDHRSLATTAHAAQPEKRLSLLLFYPHRHDYLQHNISKI